MSQPSTTDFAPMCPSAQPEMAGASVFGVVRGSAKEPRVDSRGCRARGARPSGRGFPSRSSVCRHRLRTLWRWPLPVGEAAGSGFAGSRLGGAILCDPRHLHVEAARGRRRLQALPTGGDAHAWSDGSFERSSRTRPGLKRHSRRLGVKGFD